jgi:biotin/methionine sulfoxide reductase
MTAEIRRIPHCSHWGAYTLLVQGQGIVGVEPCQGDPFPSDIIRSVQAWSQPHRRALQPMAHPAWLQAAREGRPTTVAERQTRGLVKMVPIAWDEALTLAASEIRRVIEHHGNRSIFAGSYGWTNSGRFHHASALLRRTLNLVGGFTGHVDTYSIGAGPVILRHVLGSSDACQGLATSMSSMAEHTELLLVFGALSPRTAQMEAGGLARHEMEVHLKRLAQRGVRVVHVSPQRNDLPEWLPAEWWPIKPGTDVALLLALLQELVANHRHDQAFLQTHCTGFEALNAYLQGHRDGQVKNAEWAAAITGLDASRIRQLALQLPLQRTMLSVSWSLQRAQHGEQPFWAAIALAAGIGQIGSPGAGVGFGYGSLGGVGVHANIGKPPAMSQLSNTLDSFIPVARVTDMLENPGGSFTYEGIKRTYPDVRLVYWSGGNPYHHHQDLHRLQRAWRQQPETVIVQDPMWTATALRADLVLPACTSIERNDLAANHRSDSVVAMKQAISPLGQSRSDYDIYTGLAQHLGVAEAFTEGRDEMQWLRHLYETSRTDARVRLQHEMPDFDTFWANGVAVMPHLKTHVYLQDFRANPAQHPLRTPSGKIELYSERLAQWQYDDCPAHPSWLPPQEWLSEQAQAEGWLHLLSPQPEGRLHSQLLHAGPSAERVPDGREELSVNPQDAQRLGLQHGHLAQVFNARGGCVARVKLTDTLMPGVVALPTGSWLALDAKKANWDWSGNPNTLTLDVRSSRLGQGCAAYTCLVRVQPFTDAAPSPSQLLDEGLA